MVDDPLDDPDNVRTTVPGTSATRAVRIIVFLVLMAKCSGTEGQTVQVEPDD